MANPTPCLQASLSLPPRVTGSLSASAVTRLVQMPIPPMCSSPPCAPRPPCGHPPYAQLRKEVSACHALHEEASDATEALHRDNAVLRERYRALEAESKGKEEMLDLLQEQMAGLADFDLDKVLLEHTKEGGGDQ